jgi:hypothetical protein
MAMGITQALKLQEGPIDALALLPQQQILALAQQKRIPADMVSIILNEKAQMEQQAANMQAAQQPMPRSVVEQAMAINAQAEAMKNQPQVQAQPQMMAMAPQQEMPPMDTGVASLPVPDDMYASADEGYAGGGIVAFSGEDGSLVQNSGDLNDEEYLRSLERSRARDLYSAQEAPSFASMFSPAVQQDIDSKTPGFGSPELGLGATMPAQRIPFKARTVEDIFTSGNVLRGREAPQSAQVDVIKRYLEDKARKTTDVRTDAWTRALEAGLGILGGESPYALTNIGKGSQAAVKGFAEDVKERRKQTMADMQLKLQLDEAARKEKLDAISSAERIAMSEREREARGEESALDRASREEIGRLDRENRLAIANIPDKTLQAAAQLRKANPGLSYLDSISQAAQALSPKDTYNATRSALTAAAKAVEDKMSVDPVLSGLNEKIRKGDPAAIAKAQTRKDEIEKEVFRRFQVEGVDLSSGKMTSNAAPSAAPAAPAAKPLPSKQSELQKGVVYNTQRGPATWDGKQFIPVK